MGDRIATRFCTTLREDPSAQSIHSRVALNELNELNEEVNDEPFDHVSRISSFMSHTAMLWKWVPMLRPMIVFLLSVSLAIAGCTSQNASDQETDVSTSTAAMTSKPKSKQDSATSLQPQNLAARETLAIDVDSSSEMGGVVRSIFQDARGVLWVGGEGDLLRNDGKALTRYDIKSDLGKGVTIKQIIEDKEGNIWCGTTGRITRIDGESFTSFDEKDGLTTPGLLCILDANKGRLWLGGVGGLFRYDGESFFCVRKDGPWQ